MKNSEDSVTPAGVTFSCPRIVAAWENLVKNAIFLLKA